MTTAQIADIRKQINAAHAAGNLAVASTLQSQLHAVTAAAAELFMNTRRNPTMYRTQPVRSAGWIRLGLKVAALVGVVVALMMILRGVL